MAPLAAFTCLLLSFAILSPAQADDDDAYHWLDDSHKFITRPDIEAPRFNVTIYERRRVSLGYWFVPSYDFLDQSFQNGGRWTAPHIFDGSGELIWSGSYLSRQYDAFDFRLSNVLGETMLSFLYPHNRSAILLDTSYNVRYSVPVAEEGQSVDMHEFHIVENGTKALFFYDQRRNVTQEQSRAIGWMNGNCTVNDNLFHELDVANDFQPTFTWSSAEHVGLYESSKVENSLQERCSDFWDFIHVNSLDKFPDGSYLMSSRHTDTIYKIAPDGNIVWRLGGSMSDFRAGFKFARQHNARIISSNETHTILSFFDNATKTPMRAPTSDSSRGVIVELHTQTQPMTAKLVQQFPHPDGPGNYCVARANVQVLPNGNVWICWVDGLLSTEYTPDGTLIMKTRVKQDWLKSYRTYKFSFVGKPTEPPNVHSHAIGSDEEGTTTTLVHVSWNGATEVTTWNLYKTDDVGNIDSPKPVTAVPKMGFETALSYKGFASYVVAEALDRRGAVLGRSEVIKTIVSAKLSTVTIAEESQWLDKMNRRMETTKQAIWLMHVVYVDPTVTFACGLLCGMSLLVASRALWRSKRSSFLSRRRNGSLYKRVSQDDYFEKP
ncbi:uncharacterized protein LTR77_010511 [Saxophila tyrrhenica]|uniref:ASST-domain-containing protein n=1 Tax=Saxophila tyrrhenica TaxID=1690608 RepID=A0AAV9NVX2_9PEZI|nr:hypothetical protein LTR77_010511 [Saxophila tyrrhenica]